MSAPVIDLEGVTRSFGAVRAVDGVDFSVRPGSIHGLLGPNGSGKTTLIRLILQILQPDSGRVRLFGAPATGRPDDRTGYLPEERGVYTGMTARKCLRFFGALKGMGRDDDRIVDVLEGLGAAEFVDRKVSRLSKGQAQKIQLAVALVHRPDLLILDEPFSGMDPANRELVRRMIEGIAAEGRTVVLSTHDLGLAQELCTDVSLINRGEIVEEGPLGDVLGRHPGRTLNDIFLEVCRA